MKNESHSQNNSTHSGPESGIKNESESKELTSLLAELLLYHAALGRGYISPFPPTQGLVYTSALPKEANEAFNTAEHRFRNWHVEQFKELHQEFEQMEIMPKSFLKSPENKDRYMMLKEVLSKLPFPTWNNSRTTMTDLFRLLTRSCYGALTLFDESGFRLSMTLGGSPGKLSSDLSLLLLTDGGITESMFPLRLTRGVSFFADNPPIFNFFTSSPAESLVHDLRDRITDSISGTPGIGRCVLLHGDRTYFTGTSADTLYELMMKVYVRGKDERDKRVKVTIDAESSAGWQRLFNWTQADILETEELTARARKSLEYSPATPKLSALFGARAALVKAFLTAAEGVGKTGPIHEIILGEEDLGWAKKFAKLIYLKSSGLDQVESRKSKATRGRTTSVRDRRSKHSR